MKQIANTITYDIKISKFYFKYFNLFLLSNITILLIWRA